MATNPLFTNGYYFFSNMYDDDLIGEFYRKISAETYNNAVASQHNFIGRVRKTSNGPIHWEYSIGDLTVDRKYNYRTGLPFGTRTLKLDGVVLPILDKKLFYRKYGNTSDLMIPLDDFIKNPLIFDKFVSIFIGPYRLMKGIIVVNRDKSLRLALPYDSEVYTHSDDRWGVQDYEVLDSLFTDPNEKILVFTDEMGSGYNYTNDCLQYAVEDEMNGVYKVTLNKDETRLNNLSESVLGDQSNSWDFITYYHGRGNLYESSMCYVDSETDTEITFAIPSRYVNYVKPDYLDIGLGGVYGYFIRRPNRKHMVEYTYSASKRPIINLPYGSNPAGNINVEVFEYDSSSMKRGKRLYDESLIQQYYPNIYNFTDLNVNHSDLIIEISEYDKVQVAEEMRSSIQPLFDSMGDFYTTFVVNGYDKHEGSESRIQSYNPEAQVVSTEDYVESPYYGNLRGYMLDKLRAVYATDPYVNMLYWEFMNKKDPQVVSLEGTPREFGFNIGGTGEFSGEHSVIYKTTDVIPDDEEPKTFVVPHSYITFRSNNEKVAFNLYLNGVYIRPTCQRFYRGLNYIFISLPVMTEAMTAYQTDEEIRAAKPVHLDFFPHTASRRIERSREIIPIEGNFKILKDTDDDFMRIRDLVVYDADTLEFIPDWIDHVDVLQEVNRYAVESSVVEVKTVRGWVEFSYYDESTMVQALTYDENYIKISGHFKGGRFSKDNTIWYSMNLPPVEDGWNLFFYGNDQYFMLSRNASKIAVSQDGIIWNSVNLPFKGNWYDMTYGNGKYVAIAMDTNLLAYSEDGTTWIVTASPINDRWISVTYGNDKFIAVSATTSNFVYSTSGVNWIPGELPGNDWFMILHSVDRFVIFDSDFSVGYYSMDGLTWNKVDLPENIDWIDITNSERYFSVIYTKATSQSNIGAYSIDGVNWEITSSEGEHESIASGDDSSIIFRYQIDVRNTVDYVFMDKNSDINDYIMKVSGLSDKVSVTPLGTANVSLKSSMLELESSGLLIASDIYKLMNKVTPTKELTFVPDDSLVGRKLVFMLNSYKHEYKFFGDRFTKNETNSVAVLKNALTSPDMTYLSEYTNYALFINGLLETHFSFEVEGENKMNGTVILTIDRTDLTADDECLLVHFPIPIQYSPIELSEGLKYMQPANTTGITSSSIWPDGYTPYEEGLMIHDDEMDGSMLPLEFDSNMIYSNNGYRLPQKSKSTYVENYLYYDRTKAMAFVDKNNTAPTLLRQTRGLSFAYPLDPTKFGVLGNINTGIDIDHAWFDLDYSNSVTPIQSIIYNANYVSILGDFTGGRFSEDNETFYDMNLPEIENGWKMLFYANGQYIALSKNNGIVATSPNGVDWTQSTMPWDANWYGIAYGNGKYVAIAMDSSKFAYSDDGLMWGEINIGVEDRWISVTYGNGTFVAISATTNQAIYSTDGVNWNVSTLPHAGWFSVTFVTNRFIAVNDDFSRGAYSTNGITWTEIDLPENIDWLDITDEDRYFSIIYTTSGATTKFGAYSNDGTNWEVVSGYGDAATGIVEGNSTHIKFSFQKI